MNTSLLASRAALLSGALLAAVALSACGAASSGAGGAGAASSPSTSAASGGAASASASASAASSAASTTATPTSTVTAPAGGPVPSGFAATSVTFVSPEEALVLGTAPCAKAPCTSIVRTLDRGVSWRGLPAPVVPLGDEQADTTGPAVWGIRFANADDGFVFGNGLWETSDGGDQWSSAASPGGSIESLEVIDGQLLALTAACTPNGGCGQTGTLVRRPLAGGAWQQVARVTDPGAIATQAGVAAMLDGSSVIVTTNGGLSTVKHPLPAPRSGCRPPPRSRSPARKASRWSAPEAPRREAWRRRSTSAMTSAPTGRRRGLPGAAATLMACRPGRLRSWSPPRASGASMLYYSGDGGAQWSTAFGAGDGGLGFNDLGFTTPTDGVVVYGPVLSDSNAEGRPGRLLLTSNGGASWQPVSF